jgi:hypothetical protein
MTKIYRWHVSRIYREFKSESGSPYVEVTISREKDGPDGRISSYDLEKVSQFESDGLGWWKLDEDTQIEGRTTEDKLLNALKTKHVMRKSPDFMIAPEEREIKEDMVFLHVVKDDYELENLSDSVNYSSKTHNLNPLVSIEDAFWLDFTKQARKMAKDIYKKVTKEAEVSEESEIEKIEEKV